MKKPLIDQRQRTLLRELPEAWESQLILSSVELKKCGREILKEIVPLFEKITKYLPFLRVKDKYQRYCKNAL